MRTSVSLGLAVTILLSAISPAVALPFGGSPQHTTSCAPPHTTDPARSTPAQPTISSPGHTTSSPARGPTCGTATIPPPANTALPPPTTPLQYVLLGVGTQNYSCKGLQGQAPSQIGALADLYDVTQLANCEEDMAEQLPRLVVNATGVGQASQYPKFGKHFFTTTTTPTFDLTSVNKIFYGAKSGAVAAPADAPKGPGGEAAVAWLYLTQNAGYTSTGVTNVYRVETAGGSPPATCPSESEIDKRYTALYFVY